MIISIVCYILLAASIWYVPARLKALLKLHRVWALRLAVLAVVVGYGLINAQSFTVTNFEIPISGLAGPVKIAHIPDLHLGSQRGENYLRQVIESVNSHQPDLALFNGDLVDSNIALRPVSFSPFSSLKGEKYFTTFLVSQGAGTFGPWMRVGTVNEIQIITLTPAGK